VKNGDMNANEWSAHITAVFPCLWQNFGGENKKMKNSKRSAHITAVSPPSLAPQNADKK